MEFEVVGEAPDKAPPPQPTPEEVNSVTNGNKDSAQPSTSSEGQRETWFLFPWLCAAGSVWSVLFNGTEWRGFILPEEEILKIIDLQKDQNSFDQN